MEYYDQEYEVISDVTFLGGISIAGIKLLVNLYTNYITLFTNKGTYET